MRRTIHIALLCAGCASGQPGVDLALAPDPNVNSEAQLLAAVDSIVLIVDSDEGLYPPGEERSQGSVQIENADGDLSLEVVISMPVPADHLPLVRLMQGSMPDASLELRFLGIPPERGPAVAIGSVGGVHLSVPIERLDVPFNLRPDLLPPRVTEVVPGDGATAEDCAVPQILLMFSREIDPATVAPAVSVNGAPPDSVLVDASGRFATLGVSNVSGGGMTVSYELVVTTELLDTEGRPLDQVPADPGDQELNGQYTLQCSVRTDIPTMECSPGIVCNPRLACVDGACVPESCARQQCLDGFVCDDSTGLCVADCTLWGGTMGCPDGSTCDATTGVCVQ